MSSNLTHPEFQTAAISQQVSPFGLLSVEYIGSIDRNIVPRINTFTETGKKNFEVYIVVAEKTKKKTGDYEVLLRLGLSSVALESVARQYGQTVQLVLRACPHRGHDSFSFLRQYGQTRKSGSIGLKQEEQTTSAFSRAASSLLISSSLSFASPKHSGGLTMRYMKRPKTLKNRTTAAQ
jgi:hypothetical protein